MRIYGSLRMQECRDESEIYNYQRIQLSNNKFINVILEGTLDLGTDHLTLEGGGGFLVIKNLFSSNLVGRIFFSLFFP